MTSTRLLVATALIASLGGCGKQKVDGAERYAALCSKCHGGAGEGGTGPRLDTWSQGVIALGKIIGTQMPKDNPALCRGECPPAVATYIVDTLVLKAAGTNASCSDEASQPRRLRLLSRGEYRETVKDLFGPVTAPSPSPAPCGQHTFTYDPAGRVLQTVHVAGTFNQWPGTVAAGGWAMTLANGMWTTTRTLPVGSNAYKFVLNESEWVADPANPNHQPDGVGGQNSVLDIAQCPPPGMGTGTLADPTATFPAEIRPDTFPYDDNADAQAVTSVHVQEYLNAGKRLAQAASTNLATLLACDPVAQKSACLDALTGPLGTRVFRRPLTSAEQTRYRDLASQNPDFPTGVSTALAAMLSSPSFLYRSEVGDAQPDGTFKLTAYELASELSYLLWGTMPDAALFDAARTGILDTDAGVEAQARRLLADVRSRAELGHFAIEWLGGENVLTADKQAALFPEFTTEVRAAMAEETRQFVSYVVFDGTHKLDELLTADYSFVNDTLAKIYGIPASIGPDLKKTMLPAERRAGVLTQGSVLSAYAHSDQTSPIRRGLFVRRRLLCEELPPPPPNAGGVPDVDPTATTRERFFQHTANPACAGCHQYIDSVGFGFERFDPIGRYRTMEGSKTIDASGDMTDVEKLGSETSAPFASLSELAGVLVGSRRLKDCFSRQYYSFARGTIPVGEGCAPQSLVARFEASGYDIRELIIAVTQLPDFRVRK